MFFIFPIELLLILIGCIILAVAAAGIAIYKVFYAIMWVTIALIVIFSVVMHIISFISDNGILHKLIAFVINTAISIGEGIFVHSLFSEIIKCFVHEELMSALGGIIEAIIGLPVCAAILFLGSFIIFIVLMPGGSS